MVLAEESIISIIVQITFLIEWLLSHNVLVVNSFYIGIIWSYIYEGAITFNFANSFL